MRRLYLLILIFCFTQTITSQNPDNFSPNDFFKYEDYNRALIGYLKLLDENKDDIDNNIKVGYCYLKVNGDKTKAIPHFEYVINKGNYEEDVLLYLGMAYMYDYNFDKAIKLFRNYLDITNSTSDPMVRKLIENCENAKVLVKKPLNVTFYNLGDKINSPFPDYYPFLVNDEDKLYFTTSRVNNAQKIKSSEGFYTSDIYFSNVTFGEFGKAKSIGPAVNTAQDEQCVYVTPDGKNMIIYIDNLTFLGDLFISSLKGRARYFPKPTIFHEPVNSKKMEKDGCITVDGNTLFISSNREEGFGQQDLYKLNKLPNGEWGIPINLGSIINTEYNEAFPIFDENTQTLYFSSEGHFNMGGYDIFKSKYDASTETFSTPINIGYPINTPENNIGFNISENGRSAYISAVRKEGLGDLDLYKVVFNEIEEKLSIIKGVVTSDDSLNVELNILVTLMNDSSEIESKEINAFKNGKFIFAVTPGKYTIKITGDRFEESKLVVNVYDKSSYIFDIEKEIIIHKKPEPIKPKISIPFDSLKTKKEIDNTLNKN